MDNNKVKKALDGLSKKICKESFSEVTNLVKAMGYVEPKPERIPIAGEIWYIGDAPKDNLHPDYFCLILPEQRYRCFHWTTGSQFDYSIPGHGNWTYLGSSIIEVLRKYKIDWSL
jgi:hypothetical protein